MKLVDLSSSDIKTAVSAYSQRASSSGDKEKEPMCGTIERQPDRVSISMEGLLAAEGYNKNGVKVSHRENGTYDLRFKNTAFIYDAVKRGTVEVDGKQIQLDDKAKNQLKRTADRITAWQNKYAMSAAALHNAHVYDQQYKALEKQQDKDIQAQGIASRMSRGNLVSPKEESALLKSDPELYLMAKLSQHMAEMHKKDHRQLKKEAPEKQEEWESPLDHIPEIFADVNVTTDKGNLQINTVSETVEER